MGEMNLQETQVYRVILADGHSPLRESLKRILMEGVSLDIVGEAEDAVELLKLLKQFVPHLVILDFSMPEGDGFEMTRTIKRMYPGIKVLILTMHRSQEYLRHALSAGADGYSLKEDATTEILSAVETIKRGGIYISPLLTRESG
jgi:DNA-binding NarL/FixJ family response regulator